MHTVSIIIPAYNEENYIGECLKSIQKHKTQNVCEVIVVDNASTDNTAKIASAFAGVTVVYEPVKGLTNARQCGLAAAKGELIASLDADTRVTKMWFQKMEEEFESEKDLICLSGPYEYFDLELWKKRCIKMYWKFVAMPMYGITGFMVVGGNFVARRDALLAIGGFDTSIDFYGEDTNIARRLQQKGKVKFDLGFSVQTSGRRLTENGMVRTAAVYMANFVSESLLHKPVTKSYTDVR